MGRLNPDQEQLFYSFRLDEAVPHDHPVRLASRRPSPARKRGRPGRLRDPRFASFGPWDSIGASRAP